MPEASTSSRRKNRGTEEQAEEAQGQAQDTAQDAQESTEDSGGDAKTTITGELKDTFREAAIEVLKPVMRSATKSAAKYAVTEGPSFVKDKVGPKLEEAGGAGALGGQLVKGVASKSGGVTGMVGSVAGNLMGGGKKKEGESPSGTGRGRRLPVQEFVDVGADLHTVYDQFTQFEDWPQFMHRVERIEQRDETSLMWHENIWSVRRSWEAEITDQTPCERIAWRSKGGPQTVGVVTFHRLSDRLTRVYITMDFQPKGLFEKTASGTRISRRALKSDLMRFKAFVEMRDEATGEWRGAIEEGEVVDQDEGQGDDEQGQDAEARGDEEPEDEESEDEQPTASEDEEYEDEDEESEEEEDEPRSGSRRFSRDSEQEEDEQPSAEEDEEPTAEEDEEPSAEEDEEPSASEEDEEAEEEPPARRRRSSSKQATPRRRRATTSGGSR